MLVIRYYVWYFYDIRIIVEALSLFVTKNLWADKYGKIEFTHSR